MFRWLPHRRGAAGERAAEKYLKSQGVAILARNFSCPLGEIDLIGVERDTIVFFEVKTRESDAAADPEDSIRPGKQQRLHRAAQTWLARHKQPKASYRFDAVSVLLSDSGETHIRWIRDAFRPSR